jgi:orotate phosphoribosyltransferase
LTTRRAGPKKCATPKSACWLKSCQDVVILDDVTTTGASAMVAVEEAQKAGANVILILSIVDRGEGAAEFFRQKGLPFERFFTAQEFLDSPADR